MHLNILLWYAMTTLKLNNQTNQTNKQKGMPGCTLILNFKYWLILKTLILY